jgi:hypothetical protein
MILFCCWIRCLSAVNSRVQFVICLIISLDQYMSFLLLFS